MFGNYFQNNTFKKYIIVFGTLFNDIRITRKNNSETGIQTMTVPITYGPFQKFLSMLKQDPEKKSPAITLPRMSFEITSIDYDPERKLSRPLCKAGSNTRVTATPYNISIQLSIMTKYAEDAANIVEQILPFFSPDFTPTIDLMDSIDPMDITYVLNSVNTEDAYEADFITRRSIIWTLDFTIKAYFFGPENTDQKLIKIAKANMYENFTANSYVERVVVRPTTLTDDEVEDLNYDLANTIYEDQYLDIDLGDDWNYLVTIEDSE